MSPRGEELNQKMRAEAVARITKAALEIFSMCGYHGTTMNRIMEASGSSKGLFYHYFPSKEKLFFHLIEFGLEISRNIWNGALDSTGAAWEKIEKLSRELVKTAFTDESLKFFLIIVQALTQETGIPGIKEYIYRNSSHYGKFPSVIREAQTEGEAAEGDPEVLATTYFALFQGYTLILQQDEGLKKRITAEIFTDVLRRKSNRG